MQNFPGICGGFRDIAKFVGVLGYCEVCALDTAKNPRKSWDDVWDFVFSLARPLSLSLPLTLSLSFFPGGPARAGALFLCCSSSLFRQAPTTSGRPLTGLSSALLLAPLSASLLLPPSPPSWPVSPPLCLLFSSLFLLHR